MARFLIIAALLFLVSPAYAEIYNPTAAGGSGTVTGVSVTTANGFTGSVATSTTTPAISITGAVPVALTDSGTVAWDWSTACNGKLTTTQSFTLSNPTNLTAGQVCELTVTQDGTGGRIITYGGNYVFYNGAMFVLSTAAAAVDTITCYAFTTSSIQCAGLPAFGTAGTVGTTTASAFISGGTKFSISGCSTSALVGGSSVGTFTSGTTGTCTAVITMGGATAPNGWVCDGADNTTVPALFTGLFHQTASSTTTATLAGTTVSGDAMQFKCMGY